MTTAIESAYPRNDGELPSKTKRSAYVPLAMKPRFFRLRVSPPFRVARRKAWATEKGLELGICQRLRVFEYSLERVD